MSLCVKTVTVFKAKQLNYEFIHGYNEIRELKSSFGRRAIISDLLKSIKASLPAGKGRPEVTLSYAQSLDGCIALSRGVTTTLSGVETRVLTHKLRAAHDAILVGINTVISDNPYLTVRHAEGEDPLPIVLDSHLRLPLNSNLLKNKKLPLIATTSSASAEKQARIEEAGARILRVHPDKRGWVDLHILLKNLVDSGITNIMVEGGAEVITSFLSQRLVDWLIITIAPVIIGGLHAVEGPVIPCTSRGVTQNGLKFEHFGYEQIGKDLVFWSELSWAN